MQKQSESKYIYTKYIISHWPLLRTKPRSNYTATRHFIVFLTNGFKDTQAYKEIYHLRQSGTRVYFNI